jgi:lipopolysaccharide/colanic/teichoic acid biosynthesis glycosyltransferase
MSPKPGSAIRGPSLVILELLLLLLVVALLRNLLVPGSAGMTSVAVAWVVLATTSYIVGEFESTERANYGLTVRTQAAFGLAYAAYGLIHGVWPWCEALTIRFWLALWLYLSVLAPLIGLAMRYLTRQPVLLVADLRLNRINLLRWWGFECAEVITLEDLSAWLEANSDDRGHIARYGLIVVDTTDPRTEYMVAGLSSNYFVDFMGVPSFRMIGYLLGPHPHQIASYSLSGVARRLKRIVDLVCSGTAILLLSPVLIVISFLIKLDSPGPLFYRHRRLGRNMQYFRLLKFRTMYRDADERLRHLLDSDPEMKREFEATYKLKRDPRVTRIGRFLRRFSIDELPQFFNVLTGEMSFVGPRPIVDGEVKYYMSHSLLMFRVRPGATGLWQVSGRSDTSYDNRVKLDTQYVQEWTFWDDIKIILKTLPAVLSRRGAY